MQGWQVRHLIEKVKSLFKPKNKNLWPDDCTECENLGVCELCPVWQKENNMTEEQGMKIWRKRVLKIDIE
jgi:hypothetical protein